MIDRTDTLQKQQGEEYHFAGEQKYKPLTVVANSPAEAQEKWEKQRQPVDEPAKPETPADDQE